MTPITVRYIGENGDTKPVRHSDYQHTVSGLLHKRVDLYHEAERLRDRLAEIKNDIGALDRVLGTLGYTGDLDAKMPRQKREVIFGRGELSKAIYSELRTAEGPLSSRDIAREIVTMRGVSGTMSHSNRGE